MNKETKQQIIITAVTLGFIIAMPVVGSVVMPWLLTA